jgi:cytochrome c-type biogenesis protein CcmH
VSITCGIGSATNLPLLQGKGGDGVLQPHSGRGGAAPAFAIATLLVLNVAFAQPATQDAALEARVKSLSSELRCLVCQNQTVADSDAPVARDMRDQVRAQLAAGKSEAEVKLYMTERFGDFVLYKPAFNASTLVLWVAPFIALFGGGFVLIRRLRNAQRERNATTIASSAQLSDADRERARKLLSNASDD